MLPDRAKVLRKPLASKQTLVLKALKLKSFKIQNDGGASRFAPNREIKLRFISRFGANRGKPAIYESTGLCFSKKWLFLRF